MYRRHTVPLWLPDIGACAATLCLLWALAMVASPGGPAAKLLPSSPFADEAARQTAVDDTGGKDAAENGNRVLYPADDFASGETPREQPDVTVEYWKNEGWRGL
ncbi:MAG: hypothetical protein LBS35_05140 [Synergistaceae bacterium]|nr:hypothetical protein [Synergistaceae bacterium]